MEQITDAAVRRQIDRRRVLRYIYSAGEPVTEQGIAGELSLEPSVVTGSLAELAEAGLASRSGERDGLVLEPGGRVAVGITVRRGDVRLLAIDMRAGELGRRELVVPFSHTGEYYKTLARELETFLEDFRVDRSRLLGVGITLPGIIDQASGTLVMAPTLGLWDVPLDEIYGYFSGHTVFIENDANASGYAEWWTEKGRSNMVYLSLERGVGGAIFWGEEQYTGDHGRSGEFGHMCIVPNGTPCHCGRRGCLEAYCSTARLSDDLGITLDEFFGALRAGDPEAAEIWEKYRGHLTDGLANLRTNFDCDIVVGGDLSPYLEELLPELCWELGEKTLFEGDGFFLRLAHFGILGPCAGTALRFVDDFLRTF